MIVLVETKTGIEKVLIRGEVFYKIDDNNKKGDRIYKRDLVSVLSFDNEGLAKVNPDNWLGEAQGTNFWGTN